MDGLYQERERALRIYVYVYVCAYVSLYLWMFMCACVAGRRRTLKCIWYICVYVCVYMMCVNASSKTVQLPQRLDVILGSSVVY